jgi:hypothetical protein
LNVVFTFKHLPVSAVPYYNPAATFPNIDQRYGVDWFVYVTDYLRFIPIFSSNAAIGGALLYPIAYEEINTGAIVLLTIWELLKLLVVRIPEWSDCKNIQICRNENPADNPPAAFELTSALWQWTIFFNVAFIGVLIVYIFLATQIKSGQKAYYENLKKKGITIYVKPVKPEKEADGEMNAIFERQFKKYEEGMKRYAMKKLGWIMNKSSDINQ